MIGEEVRRRREELRLTGAQLAAKASMAPSAVSQIETGKRTPSSASVIKLAAALGVEVGDLYPQVPTQLPLVDAPSLEDLHAEAGCETDWLITPEEKWIAAWPLSLTPEEAMRIVRELHREFSRLEPLLAKQEQDLPVSRRMFNGRYGQAWQRFFSGLQAAHECGIVHGIIERDETLNDLAEKLGEKPTESFKKLQLAS